eukprot:3011405-Prymnesium_polylepis.1
MAQRAKNEELWQAAAKGNQAEVERLKGEGAEATWFHPWEPAGRGYQFTALHIAADQGHLDVVKYFLETCKMDMKLKSATGPDLISHLTGESSPTMAGVIRPAPTVHNTAQGRRQGGGIGICVVDETHAGRVNLRARALTIFSRVPSSPFACGAE